MLFEGTDLHVHNCGVRTYPIASLSLLGFWKGFDHSSIDCSQRAIKLMTCRRQILFSVIRDQCAASFLLKNNSIEFLRLLFCVFECVLATKQWTIHCRQTTCRAECSFCAVLLSCCDKQKSSMHVCTVYKSTSNVHSYQTSKHRTKHSVYTQ